MELHWPQYVYLAMLVATLVYVAKNDGKPAGNHMFVVTLIARTLACWLLYMGGFFG